MSLSLLCLFGHAPMVCAGCHDSSSSVFKSGGGQAALLVAAGCCARCTRVCVLHVPAWSSSQNNPTYGCALAGAAAKSFVAAACGMKAHSRSCRRMYAREQNVYARTKSACVLCLFLAASALGYVDQREGACSREEKAMSGLMDGRLYMCCVYRSLLVSLCACSVCFRMGCKELNQMYCLPVAAHIPCSTRPRDLLCLVCVSL